uniref:Uncharacterized protein n=1 Tax=Rhizophora mucronata TaxID=61149 RepID=A0A2P2K4B3_RHIMU
MECTIRYTQTCFSAHERGYFTECRKQTTPFIDLILPFHKCAVAHGLQLEMILLGKSRIRKARIN